MNSGARQLERVSRLLFRDNSLIDEAFGRFAEAGCNRQVGESLH